MSKTYKDWYLRGYEEGLKEAWEEVARMAARGHTSKEIQLYLRSRKASLHQSLREKEVEFVREVGSSEPAPYGHKQQMQPQQQAPAPVPQQSAPSKPESKTELRPGYSYLIREDKPDKSYSLLKHLVTEGHPAICVTRTHPSHVRDQYNIGGARIVWLTKKEGGMSLPSGLGVPAETEERISPSKLSELGSSILRFMRENKEKGGVILLDGMDYLISQNDSFQPILKFIQYINENAAEHGAFFLLPVGEGFNKEHYSMLRKELTAEVR